MQASLRRSGTPYDIVTLVDTDVGPYYRRILESDGTIVLDIPKKIDNSYAGDAVFQDRFAAVMSKLNMFNMTQYEKIVYLDADTMMIDQFHKSNDVLFKCGDLCAVFINPCIFNSGVMVIKPSSKLFEDMISKVSKLHSYDGADQGFLNSYFSDLLSAPLFDPEKVGNEKLHGNYRLPTPFHVDHFLFYQRGKWDMPCLQPRILEFMGPAFLKPWNWWTYVILDLSWEWLHIKQNLPNSESEFFPFLCYLGFTAVVFLGVRIFLKSRTRGALMKRVQQKKMSESVLLLQSLTTGFAILLVCMYIAFCMINPSMHPSYAIFTFLLWSHVLTPTVYFVYCVVSFQPHQSARTEAQLLNKTILLASIPVATLFFFSFLWKLLGIIFLFKKISFLIVAAFVQIFSFFAFFGFTASLWIKSYENSKDHI